MVATLGAVMLSLGGAPMVGTNTTVAPVKIAHSGDYLRCVNYTRKIVHECRIGQRQGDQSVRPCNILSNSYSERCAAS